MLAMITIRNDCQVRADHTPHHMHHKFCILDGSVLMNGSFNWTQEKQLCNTQKHDYSMNTIVQYLNYNH